MTDAQPTANRRLTARQACQLSVRYKVDKTWHPATVIDLSQTGCRLRLGEELNSGLNLTVLFELPLRDGSKTPSVEIRGVVTWCQLQGLSHQAGILFSEAPPELAELFSALG